MDGCTHAHIVVHADRQRDRQTYRQTDRQAGRETDRHIDRRTGRETDRHTYRQTMRSRQNEAEFYHKKRTHYHL